MHLVKTARGLREGDKEYTGKLSNQAADEKEIQMLLTHINELVRISIYLSKGLPEDSSLSLETMRDNYPNINVNYYPIQQHSCSANRCCQALLIDTPGPNEAAGVVQLSKIVNKELKQADVVLIVMEYGHLNTEVDAKLANEIKRIRSIKENRACVYALVNKADLRQEEDMSVDDLREHVAKTYEIPSNCVFTLSARRALYARKFLTDYEQQGDALNVEKSTTARTVLQTYFPINWKTQLKTKPEDVAHKAEELYQGSGIGDFLEKAIETVLGQVLRRCVESGTDECKKVDSTLINSVDIRLTGLELLEDKLKEEIKNLTVDLRDLANVETNLPAAKEMATNLESELKHIFQITVDHSEKEIKRHFNLNRQQSNDEGEDGYQSRKNDVEANVSMAAMAVGLIGSGLMARSYEDKVAALLSVSFGALLTMCVKQTLSSLMSGNHIEEHFDSEENAKKRIREISDAVNSLSKEVYEKIEDKVKQACQTVIQDISSQLDRKAVAILDRASQRFNTLFHVELLPPPQTESTLKEMDLNLDDVGYTRRGLGAMLQSMVRRDSNDNPTWCISLGKIAR